MRPLTPTHYTLISAATNAISHIPLATSTHPFYTHTVGSAILCSDGRIITGINFYHFTGGPCAEIVALANSAAAGIPSVNSPAYVEGGVRVVAIVAVRNGRRGVLSPCGRCRQVLWDGYKGVEVIVRDEKGGGELKLVGIGELLPFAYDTIVE